MNKRMGAPAGSSGHLLVLWDLRNLFPPHPTSPTTGPWGLLAYCSGASSCIINSSRTATQKQKSTRRHTSVVVYRAQTEFTNNFMMLKIMPQMWGLIWEFFSSFCHIIKFFFIWVQLESLQCKVSAYFSKPKTELRKNYLTYLTIKPLNDLRKRWTALLRVF